MDFKQFKIPSANGIIKRGGKMKAFHNKKIKFSLVKGSKIKSDR